MKSTDIRDQLKSIAAGKDPRLAAILDKTILQAEFVRKHQPAFRAWKQFAGSCLREPGGNRGEPLSAPAELLTPLP